MKELIMMLSIYFLLTSSAMPFEATTTMRVVAIHPKSDGCNINYILILWNEDGYASAVKGELKDLRLGDLVVVKLEPRSGEKELPRARRVKIIRKVKN